MSENAKRAAFFRQRVKAYRTDISLFAREQLHFEPDDWQEAVFRDMVEANRVSVKSGQGVGKTGVESIVALWFLSCFSYAKVVATAPTASQLNDVLWAEIDKWLSRSPVLSSILHWTKTYVYVNGYEKRWFATARTAAKPENMQGFHEDNMLFIVDEASGIAEQNMEAILGTLSGINNKLLMCGNPTKVTGTFYDSHTSDRARYRTHTVSSEDSKRTNKDNIKALEEKYGRESNVFRVRVLGQFPEQEDDVFIPLTLVEQAVITELDMQVIRRISIGVDVARFGDDETVICTNINGRIELPKIRHGQNLMQTVGDIVATYEELIATYPDYTGVITAVIDDTGLGGGVTDRLNEVKMERHLSRLEVVPVNFAEKPPKGGENYCDIASYMWATVRSLMQKGEISLQNDNETVAQFSVRKYYLTSSAKIYIEPKKDMKKRGIKSPDRADAVAMSCFTPNKVYTDFIEQEATIVIPISAVPIAHIMRINIGISNVGTDTAFVATAILSEYSRAICLSSVKVSGVSEPAAICEKFRQFSTDILVKYGRLDYAYCDNGYFLYRSIKETAARSNLQMSVREAMKADAGERIKITQSMIALNRLTLTDNCGSLSASLSAATWDEKTNRRNETPDSCLLNAFEYTVEREGTRFISSTDKGGQ